MFWGVWCSRPTMVEPSTRMPFFLNSVVSACVSVPLSLAYSECSDSNPIQTHDTPSSTSSSIVYLRIALADEKTYISQLLPDRKSTRLNSSHLGISYAVFCL